MADQHQIAVTGAEGQLGKELRALSEFFPDLSFCFLSQSDLSITDQQAIQNYFSTNKPAYLVNCAAYTAVDKAEEEPEKAFLVNAEAVGFLAAVCKKHNTKFLHISTDYVFDGRSERAYTEEDVTAPINVYGHSKWKGELLAREQNPEAIIIRTSWLYSAFGTNFLKTMVRLMSEKKEIHVVNDQFGSPTYAADLAQVLLMIIKRHKQFPDSWHPGIYHFSNEGVISWYEFALAIKKITGTNCIVHPVPTTSFPTAAKRPQFSVLNKDKIRNIYGINPEHWMPSLEKCIGRLMRDN